MYDAPADRNIRCRLCERIAFPEAEVCYDHLAGKRITTLKSEGKKKKNSQRVCTHTTIIFFYIF
jgi:hypothetical protein